MLYKSRQQAFIYFFCCICEYYNLAKLISFGVFLIFYILAAINNIFTLSFLIVNNKENHEFQLF